MTLARPRERRTGNARAAAPAVVLAAIATLAATARAGADAQAPVAVANRAVLAPHLEVLGGRDVLDVEVRASASVPSVASVASVPSVASGAPWRPTPWQELGRTTLDPGTYEVRARIGSTGSDEAVQVPPCAGRTRIALDGRELPARAGPVVVRTGPGAHEVVIGIEVSRYERRIACGAPPRIGVPTGTVEGLGELAFDSPQVRRGGGRAVVYVPPGHDAGRPGPLLVGTHPWNGSPWTYAAYAELLTAASARDVVLLMPSGLGNSLYTAEAEDEVLRAVDALSATLAVDPQAISIWGASMGGAGATTIAFHHPDRFAAVTSFFGDSQYDLSAYVRSILHDDAAAHRVNAFDVIDNARYLQVRLVHGEDDRTSPIRQSELLATALYQHGFAVSFERVAHAGHSGALVASRLAEVVAMAAAARSPASVERVTYRSVRASDQGAYGVRIERSSPTRDAFVDVERRADAVHVLRAEGVRALSLSVGALGTSRDHPPSIVVDPAVAPIAVGWEATR